MDNKFDNNGKITKKIDPFGSDSKVADHVFGAFRETSEHENQLALFISKIVADNSYQSVNNSFGCDFICLYDE